MGGISNPELVRNTPHMTVHLCQAEIEMIVLAASVIRNPYYGKRASQAVRGYMKQLIEEIKKYYGNPNGR